MFTLDPPTAQAGQAQLYRYEADPSAFAPAVTIVTVANDTGADWAVLAGCLQSQSLQQWEWLIILVDAEPATPDLAALAECDPRIRVIGEHSGSATSASNR